MLKNLTRGGRRARKSGTGCMDPVGRQAQQAENTKLLLVRRFIYPHNLPDSSRTGGAIQRKISRVRKSLRSCVMGKLGVSLPEGE